MIFMANTYIHIHTHVFKSTHNHQTAYTALHTLKYTHAHVLAPVVHAVTLTPICAGSAVKYMWERCEIIGVLETDSQEIKYK